MATSRWLGGALIVLAVGIVVGMVSGGREVPPAGVDAPTATIAIYGRADSFGGLDNVPSGQRLERRAVPGWGFPAGIRAGVSTLGADGTVFLAGQNFDVKGTADEAVIAAYESRANSFASIRLRTTTGRDRASGPTAPSVSDVEAIAGGEAIAFTTAPTIAGQEASADGDWPAFGLLTKVDGRWQVGSGNQWTGADLKRSNPRTCPVDSECGKLGDMAVLPQSHDIIVARRDSLIALRVTGPGDGRRYTLSVVGHFRYPAIPGQVFDVRSVRADPTGRPRDERFAVIVGGVTDDTYPQAAQEFSYDGAGAIRPVTAPFMPGDRVVKDGPFYGFSQALYDHAGNLWLARHHWIAGGRLAVYAMSDGKRRPGGVLCPRGDSYRLAVSVESPKRRWDQTCRPDYDIDQAKELLVGIGLVEDPTSHSVLMLSLLGALLPVRASQSGPAMTFQVGNLVDTASRLLPSNPGSFIAPQFGAIDRDHRLWYPVTHSRGTQRATADQWLYALSLNDLFEPAPVEISDIPGRQVTIQAEYTTTTGTKQRDGSWATKDVISTAHRTGCQDGSTHTGCGHDKTAGDGFVLRDSSGYGVMSGRVEYRIRVPKAGTYRISYRVYTFEPTKDARIELTVGDTRYVTPVSTNGAWQTKYEVRTIALAAGIQTISLGPPKEGGGGWYLNSFSLRRA